MKFYDTYNDGLTQTMDRLCGSSTTAYPYKNKAIDLNESLDWYLQLAFKADCSWNFDDLGESSPPIDTQNLVSGTNRYKFSSFTEKILNLLKLEILDSAGNSLPLIPETLNSFGNILGNASGQVSDIGNKSFNDLYVNADSGTPTHYVKYGDFVYLRPKPNYSYTAGLLAFFNRPITKFEFVSVVAEADDDTFTATAHGLTTNDTVMFEVDSAGTLPTNLSADTQYYVIASGLTTNVFKVSTTLGGSTINITTDGSNLHFIKTNAEPGVPVIHHFMLARKASSLYMSFNNTNGVFNARLSTVLAELAKDEERIKSFFSNRTKDQRRRMTPFLENDR